MRPLIEIQTIPIEIQMKTTNAHLEYARGTAQMEVSPTDAGSRSAASPFGSTLILLRRAVLSSPPPPRASSRGQPRDSVRHTRLPPSWRRRAA